MKFFGIACIFVCALVTISSAATKYYITAPSLGMHFKPDQPIEIKWKNGESGKFTIQLLVETDKENHIFLDTHFPLPNADGTTGSYTWYVPHDFPPATYAIRLVYGRNNKKSYSPKFQIGPATD